MPIKVIPTCIDDKKLSGLSSSFAITLARLFHLEASMSIFDFFTETSAISVRAKNQLSKVSTPIIINSIYFFIMSR